MHVLCLRLWWRCQRKLVSVCIFFSVEAPAFIQLCSKPYPSKLPAIYSIYFLWREISEWINESPGVHSHYFTFENLLLNFLSFGFDIGSLGMVWYLYILSFYPVGQRMICLWCVCFLFSFSIKCGAGAVVLLIVKERLSAPDYFLFSFFIAFLWKTFPELRKSFAILLWSW